MLHLLTILIALLAWAPAAQAVEYRLQVANLHERAFAHFMDGKLGRGAGELTMERLERALETGGVSSGAFVGRALVPARGQDAAGFAAVAVRPEVRPAEGAQRWDEAVWDGKPGERSLWVIPGFRTHQQEIVHVALKGRGPLRHYLPYRIAGGWQPVPVAGLPLGFLHFHQERGALWERYLARAVAFPEGIAAVVGVNDNPTFADWLYILVEQPAEPTTFKVVVAWDRRPSTSWSDIEGATRD
jgi:hypothetical protein